MARAGKPRKHVFVCVNQRDPEHPRPSCLPRGGGDVFEMVREFSGAHGLDDVKVVASFCLEPCMVGPVVYVAPDDGSVFLSSGADLVRRGHRRGRRADRRATPA